MNTEKFRTLLVLGACSLVGGLLFAPSALAAAPNLSVSIAPSHGDTEVPAGVPVTSMITITNTATVSTDVAMNALLTVSGSLNNAVVQSVQCSRSVTPSGSDLDRTCEWPTL